MSREPLVLMYHGVGWRPAAADPFNLFVSPEAFQTQLEWLAEAGWRPIDLTEYLSGDAPPRSFLVTFDDGYADVLTYAAPILKEMGVPAVLFAVPDLLGGTSCWEPLMPSERLMTADELRRLPDYGIEVGAHGLDHTSMAGLDPDALRRHTENCGWLLAETTGTVPRAFAYPYGHHDAAAREAVLRAGYRAGFAVYEGGGSAAIPRVDVNARDTEFTFKMKTLRSFPIARRMLGRAPVVRAGVHNTARLLSRL